MPGNGCVESFDGGMRGEPLAAEAFNTPAEAKALVERRRARRNAARPHPSPGCGSPAPEAAMPSAPSPPGSPDPPGPAQPRATTIH
jgi:hypothetical protein